MNLVPRWPGRRVSTAAQLRILKSQVSDAYARRQPAEAEAVARAVMDAYADDDPIDNLFLTAWEACANARQMLGQYAAAADEYTTMIDTASPAIGTDAPRVMDWRHKRGGLLNILGRYGEAETDCRTAMEIADISRPDRYGDKYRLLVADQLVIALIGQGMLASAESVARSAVAEASAITDMPESVVVTLRRVLSSCLNAQERYAEAEENLRGLRPSWPGVIPGFKLVLGTAQLGLGQVAEAEVSAREAVVSAAELYPSGRYTTLMAGTLLGAVLARQGNIDEARSELRANVTAWTEHFGTAHPKAVDAQRELAKTDGGDGV